MQIPPSYLFRQVYDDAFTVAAPEMERPAPSQGEPVRRGETVLARLLVALRDVRHTSWKPVHGR
jgi:hypothetical protein